MSIRLLVLAALAALLLAGCRATSVPDTTSDAPPLLLISIDGFRHDYLDMTRLPVLERLAEEGLRADGLMQVFPTKTFPTHYATATGLYAENTGVVANNMWDPDRGTHFSLGDRDAVMDGYWYDGEPIWNTVEKAGGVAATYFWPGSEAPIGGMRPTIFKLYDGQTPHDARVDQVLEWLDLPPGRRPDFLTLYFSAVDSAGHAHGPGHPRTLDAAREVDRALGRLLDGLAARGLLGNMHILVTSDHGMQRVSADRLVMLNEIIDSGDVMVSDWGPAAQIWTIDGGPDGDTLLAALDGAHPAIARVWKKGEGPPRYRFERHPRVPDITVEAELGWLISNPPRAAGMRQGNLSGMHGWDPAWRSMQGLFIAHGPAFAAGDRLPTVRSVDLYSLMAELMDVPPARTDGSLAAFRPLLSEPAPLSVTEQRWQCGDTTVVTRIAPGLAGLHAGGRVFALPRAISAEGRRFADPGNQVWLRDGQAFITLEGIDLGQCRATPAN